MDISEKRLVRTLQELVRIPSHESMEKISEYVASEIRKAGLKPEVDRDGNVLASIGSGEGFMLNAHLDTVGIKDYPEAFSGKVKGERLYGRGSTDCKAGVAAMLEILRVLARDPPKKRVVFAFTVWEEGGGPEIDGAYKVAKRVDAKRALVLEDSVKEDSTSKITIGCKGRMVFEVEVLGRASHSGLPEKGRNAIYLASELITALRDFTPRSMDVPGYGTISSVRNVTEISSREGRNVIPGKCSVIVDYRSLPGEREDDVRKALESACRKSLGSYYRIRVVRSKGGFLAGDSGLIESCRNALSEQGLEPGISFSYGWNDSYVFSREGMAALELGPGTIGQGHRNPEYCWLPGLEKCTRAILNVIKAWDRGNL